MWLEALTGGEQEQLPVEQQEQQPVEQQDAGLQVEQQQEQDIPSDPETLVYNEITAELEGQLERVKSKRRLAWRKPRAVVSPDQVTAEYLFDDYRRTYNEYTANAERVKYYSHNLGCEQTESRNRGRIIEQLLKKVVQERQAAAEREATAAARATAASQSLFRSRCAGEVQKCEIRRHKRTRDKLAADYQALLKETDSLQQQKDKLQLESDSLQLQRDTLQQEKTALQKEKAALQQASASKEATIRHQNRELWEQLNIIAEQDTLIERLRNPPFSDDATSGYRAAPASQE